MGFDVFTVVIEPLRPEYCSGQIVEGYITFAADEPVPLKYVKLTAGGIGQVSWYDNDQTYFASEEYFRETHTIWSRAHQTEKFPAGEHKYPFAFQIPEDIPSSFQSEIGKVEYLVEAVAKSPLLKAVSTTAGFLVNQPYDLNSHSDARTAIIREREKAIRCCCARWGPITLTLAVEKRGYVRGENIVINGEIVNNSGSTIKYTEAKIVQKITYITSASKMTVKRTIQRVYHPQLQSGRTDEWSRVLLPVPAATPSYLVNCNIINVEYNLVFEAILGKCKRAKIKENIIIGSVPLAGTAVAPHTSVGDGGAVLANPVGHEDSPSSEESRRPGQGGDEPPPYNRIVMSEEYANVPPPSYDSCVFSGGRQSAVDNDSDSDEGGFVPHYITYRRN
ncbi:arrestin domain-containing protein 4 isoform X1 [Penaeus vannamei]|uniref:arrestin domain-containing protein 4 isoform X1 n=1 Tax=Penaeus vannamei TaxID=6689 RepID=UPI00387FA7CB